MNRARKWLAFGTGAGVEIDGTDLRASVVRVRRAQIEVLGQHAIENFREKPAAEWGAELAAFFDRAGAPGRPVTVVLPSPDAVSRTVVLPGVPKKELAAALAFEIDALSPYGEGDTASAWMPVADSTVLASMARAATVAQYADLFTEAGIPVAGFTTPPAAIYSALRQSGAARRDFLAIDARSSDTRLYGEGGKAAVFWTSMEQVPDERAVALARAQMRLDESAETTDLTALLPGGTLAGAAATAAACPWLTRGLNLMPTERRVSRSPWMFAPTMALASLTVLAGVALAGFRQFEDRRLLGELNREIAKIEPMARSAAEAERARAASASRIDQLKNFRDRTRKDLDVFREVTRLISPPAWSLQFDVTRTLVNVAGESGSAAEMLKTFDASPLFRNSEFMSPLTRSNTSGMDVFRLRSEREGPAR